MSRHSIRPVRSPLAKFVGSRIRDLQHLRSQREIAIAAGMRSVNQLSMIKAGTAKLPLERVADLAHALNCDERLLTRLALEQFHSPHVVTLIENAMQPSASAATSPAVALHGRPERPRVDIGEFIASCLALRIEVGRIAHELANAGTLARALGTRIERSQSGAKVLLAELDDLNRRSRSVE